MTKKDNGLIIGSMSAGRSNWFSPVICVCGTHYQGIYERFKYQSNRETLPINKCPKCGKSIVQVNWLDYESEKTNDQ